MANSKELGLPRCRFIPDAVRRSSTDPLLLDDLMWEILTWLPVKSLMRFKCVSRLWKSSIQAPSFAGSYRGGFRGVLISAPGPFFRLAFETDFYHVSMRDTPDHSTDLQLSHNLTVCHGGRTMGSTSVVNGLVCFFDCNRSYLFNIATRERMELPVSMYEAEGCAYHLGFDPFNKLYKLLKTCPVYEDGSVMFDGVGTFVRNLNCEILTIGVDSSWRSIGPAPLEILTRAACYNGVLYWLELERDEGLIAFHLAQEKFQIISNPDFNAGYIPHFGPGLAIVRLNRGGTTNTADIYRSVGGSPGWTKSQIPLPPVGKGPEWDEQGYAPAGTLPNGKTFIVGNRYCDTTFPVSFYLYDPIKGQLEKIVVRRSPAPCKDICGYVYYHEDNIMPLSCLNSFP